MMMMMMMMLMMMLMMMMMMIMIMIMYRLLYITTINFCFPQICWPQLRKLQCYPTPTPQTSNQWHEAGVCGGIQCFQAPCSSEFAWSNRSRGWRRLKGYVAKLQVQCDTVFNIFQYVFLKATMSLGESQVFWLDGASSQLTACWKVHGFAIFDNIDPFVHCPASDSLDCWKTFRASMRML